jgi:DNA topoisomerase I
MFSDDEQPLATNNGRPSSNGNSNGGLNGHLSDISMSGDDDVPLVRAPIYLFLQASYN